MKISAILMSRVLAFVDTVDLRPTSGLPLQEFIEEIVKQYDFKKFPQTIEEFNPQKGIEFVGGRLNKTAITKLVIWPNLLVIEGRCATNECQKMLSEILEWATPKFDLTYKPEMITRYAYVSDLSIESTAPLLTYDPLLARIAEKVGKSLTEIWNDQIKYEAIEFKIGHDPLDRKWGIAPFQITRRAEHKFTENKYFSEAPLPTHQHIALLEEYEKGIIERTRVN